MWLVITNLSISATETNWQFSFLNKLLNKGLKGLYP